METRNYTQPMPFLYTKRPTREDDQRHWWLSSASIPLNHVTRWEERPDLTLRCDICTSVLDYEIDPLDPNTHPKLVRDERGTFDPARIFMRCHHCRNAFTLELREFAFEDYEGEARALLILLSMDAKQFCGITDIKEEKDVLTRITTACFLDCEDHAQRLHENNDEDAEDGCSFPKIRCQNPSFKPAPVRYGFYSTK